MKRTGMISKIVRLRKVVEGWKSRSLARRGSLDDRRIRSGSIAVYVGPEPDRARFFVPTRFLNLPVFAALLDMAEEEFGFRSDGALALPCDAGFFAEVLRLLEMDEEKFGGMSLDELLKMVGNSGGRLFSPWACKELLGCSQSFGPMRPKTTV